MAEVVFKPDEEIPAWFWEIVDRVRGDEDRLEEALAELDEDGVFRFFRWLNEAGQEMIDQLIENGAFEDDWDGSEDTMEDLGRALVSSGKGYYLDVFCGRQDPPPEEEWDDLPNLADSVVDHYFERFGKDVFDRLLDDPYP